MSSSPESKTGTIGGRVGRNTMSSLYPASWAHYLWLLGISLTALFSPQLSANEAVTVKSGLYQTAVIELYTSEGCSSCPPADRWLNQLTKVPSNELDKLVLAFHVDYWDYIGWKDIYARPSFTNRQRHLARLNQQKSIYTPEFFVNGSEARGTQSVVNKTQLSNKVLSTVDMELTFQQQKNNIVINLSSKFDPELLAFVHFVVYENNLSSQVKRGENAGKHLQHQQVVRYLSPKKSLTPEITHNIKIQPEWNLNQLGVGAFALSKSGPHIQAVSSQLTAFP
ncbi:MAG: DUF1223 domain-containing protein [Gammaproteobacteria bacterium]|nr:DUF1223 domain-containing protein [Gammaproteobacteria bacterium]